MSMARSRSIKTKIKVTPVKVGRRVYGGICQLSDGTEVYLAYRSVAEIYRSGEKSIAEAIRKGTACWAIDETTLNQMRSRKIRFVGVLLKDTGDRFLTPIENFFDAAKAKVLNYSRRGGSLQRFLPLHEFTRRAGKIVKRR